MYINVDANSLYNIFEQETTKKQKPHPSVQCSDIKCTYKIEPLKTDCHILSTLWLKMISLFSLICEYDRSIIFNHNICFSLNNDLKYFSPIQSMSNSGLLTFNWLTNLHPFTPLPRSASYS